jgi:calcineurin-like phosphoesterase
MTPERSGSMLKVLLIGDVVGGPGRKFLRERLPGLKKRLGADAAVVNGETEEGKEEYRKVLDTVRHKVHNMTAGRPLNRY